MTYSSALVATDDFFSAYTSSGNSTRIAGHAVLNLGATYKDQNKSLTFFVDNLTDKPYFLNAGYYNYDFFSPKTRGQVGAPRTIGIKAKLEF
jgi:outer membrane receptor protein involved in Fe transport